MESSLFDDELPQYEIVEPQPDDPFIIVHRNSVKKSSFLRYVGIKSAKSKFIKRDKIDKIRLKGSVPENEEI